MLTKEIISHAANLAHCYDEDGVLIETYVLGDNCHFGHNMQKLYKLLDSVYYRVETSMDGDQGFVTSNGKYLNRKDSYVLAKGSGQPYNDEFTLKSNKTSPELDSSCIRHFEEDKPWGYYMDTEVK